MSYHGKKKLSKGQVMGIYHQGEIVAECQVIGMSGHECIKHLE